MNSPNQLRCGLRTTSLALCVATALGCAPIAQANEGVSNVRPAVAGRVAGAIPVTSCADDGSEGTLRSVIASAPGGATIDLTQLTCSVITLQTGAINTQFQSVTLLGPGADRLTIDGNYLDRVFKVGSITIEGLTVTHGRVSGDIYASGGCIQASLGVVLRSARVVSCSVYGDVGVSGGGIAAGYYVRLLSSIVSNNTLVSASGYAHGGGISAPYNGVTAAFSAISGNTAAGFPSRGGGVFAMGLSRATNSTIDNNVADMGGGWFCERSWLSDGRCEIVDSTVSGNTAHSSGGGLVVYQASIDFRNSTFAFNTAETGDVGGVLITGYGTYPITLQSSIFANNTAAGTVLAADIDTDSGNFPTVIGGDDLMTSIGYIQPSPFIFDDPKLGPLAFNGGTTRTHALKPGSPAIDTGNNVAALEIDQRGNARVVGAAADIGAYEVQPEQIFANGFD